MLSENFIEFILFHQSNYNKKRERRRPLYIVLSKDAIEF